MKDFPPANRLLASPLFLIFHPGHMVQIARDDIAFGDAWALNLNIQDRCLGGFEEDNLNEVVAFLQ